MSRLQEIKSRNKLCHAGIMLTVLSLGGSAVRAVSVDLLYGRINDSVGTPTALTNSEIALTSGLLPTASSSVTDHVGLSLFYANTIFISSASGFEAQIDDVAYNPVGSYSSGIMIFTVSPEKKNSILQFNLSGYYDYVITDKASFEVALTDVTPEKVLVEYEAYSGNTKQGTFTLPSSTGTLIPNHTYVLEYSAMVDSMALETGKGSVKLAFSEVPVPVPLPAAAGVGLSMLAGCGGLFGLRKKLNRRGRIA